MAGSELLIASGVLKPGMPATAANVGSQVAKEALADLGQLSASSGGKALVEAIKGCLNSVSDDVVQAAVKNGKLIVHHVPPKLPGGIPTLKATIKDNKGTTSHILTVNGDKVEIFNTTVKEAEKIVSDTVNAQLKNLPLGNVSVKYGPEGFSATFKNNNGISATSTHPDLEQMKKEFKRLGIGHQDLPKNFWDDTAKLKPPAVKAASPKLPPRPEVVKPETAKFQLAHDHPIYSMKTGGGERGNQAIKVSLRIDGPGSAGASGLGGKPKFVVTIAEGSKTKTYSTSQGANFELPVPKPEQLAKLVQNPEALQVTVNNCLGNAFANGPLKALPEAVKDRIRVGYKQFLELAAKRIQDGSAPASDSALSKLLTQFGR